jgi:hypothetical protein
MRHVSGPLGRRRLADPYERGQDLAEEPEPEQGLQDASGGRRGHVGDRRGYFDRKQSSDSDEEAEAALWNRTDATFIISATTCYDSGNGRLRHSR